MLREPVNLLGVSGVHVTTVLVALRRPVSAMLHSIAEDVATRTRTEIRVFSKQAVYHALGTLTEQRLSRGMQSAALPASNEGGIGDNLPDVIGRGGATMADVECAIGNASCLTIAPNSGHRVNVAEVVYSGILPFASFVTHSGTYQTNPRPTDNRNAAQTQGESSCRIIQRPQSMVATT